MKNTIFFIAICLSFVACIKDPLNNTPTNSTPTTPSAPANCDATLWAVKSNTKYDPGFGLPQTTIQLGTGIGLFSSNGLSSASITRVNVGTVKLNSTSMDYIGESYITTATSTNPTGIDFSGGVTWEVSGDNGFSAFTHTPTNSFPSVSDITSGTTVTKASGYTLTCNTVSGADSVLFLVGDVHKTLGGNATFCTFSSSELSSLGNGTQLVQIVPYSYTTAVFGGKTICFGKEMVQQLSVTVQ